MEVFWGSFFPNLEGFTQIMKPDAEMFRLYMPDIAAFVEEKVEPGETVVCTGKIKHVGSSYIDDFKYLAALVKPEEVKNIKITLAAPNWYHMRYKEGYAYSKDAYTSDEEYFGDIAKAYQEELRILYEAGCRNVQYDDPNLACESLPSFSRGLRTRADDG
jgi:methionine synthase II (cobalamin-independent)